MSKESYSKEILKKDGLTIITKAFIARSKGKWRQRKSSHISLTGNWRLNEGWAKRCINRQLQKWEEVLRRQCCLIHSIHSPVAKEESHYVSESGEMGDTLRGPISAKSAVELAGDRHWGLWNGNWWGREEECIPAPTLQPHQRFQDWQKCLTHCTSNPGYPESSPVDEFIQASFGGLGTKSANDFSSGKQNKRTVFMQHLLPHSLMVIKQFYNSANSVT